MIAEENADDYDIADWKAVIVDGENVKADTWYCLKDGELCEGQSKSSGLREQEPEQKK